MGGSKIILTFGAKTYYLARFLSRTAWKWKKWDFVGSTIYEQKVFSVEGQPPTCPSEHVWTSPEERVSPNRHVLNDLGRSDVVREGLGQGWGVGSNNRQRDTTENINFIVDAIKFSEFLKTTIVQKQKHRNYFIGHKWNYTLLKYQGLQDILTFAFVHYVSLQPQLVFLSN